MVLISSAPFRIMIAAAAAVYTLVEVRHRSTMPPFSTVQMCANAKWVEWPPARTIGDVRADTAEAAGAAVAHANGGARDKARLRGITESMHMMLADMLK